ncbi:hypothetical protein HOLleu_25120 [Holothuria leucospilota]|uniref:Uncharacterized protein n=1 Tax=Holothuria leucospilota TaxID=206669 RepID=A0A9Q1BSF6_HOLLE|nr:hypothetical protein HOLleu_25120 [Holothuria leucospilota]
MLEDKETLRDDSDEEEHHLIETIQQGLTKVDRLCEELSFPNYTNLENALRSCCGISANIRRRLCFLKTIPHKTHQRKRVKRLCKRLEAEVYGNHPMLATRSGSPFRECCELSGQRKKLSCMKRAKHVQFDSFCERFESQEGRGNIVEAKHWKKCCAMETTERRRCMSWRNGQSKTDKRCRILQWKELEGNLTERQTDMAHCCLLDEPEGRRQCFKELEWDGYNRMCVKQEKLFISGNRKDNKKTRYHPCCNETENERYECFEERVRSSNRRKQQRQNRPQKQHGPWNRRRHGPQSNRGDGNVHAKLSQDRSSDEGMGIHTVERENDMIAYSRSLQNTSTNEEEDSREGNFPSRRFSRKRQRANRDRSFSRYGQSHQEQDGDSEVSRQKRSADSATFVPSLLMSVAMLKEDLLGIAEIHRINTLCKDLRYQGKVERRGRGKIIRCCNLKGEKRIECIMRSARGHINAICAGEMSSFPFQLGRFGEYVDPTDNMKLFTSDHECCSFDSRERYKCVEEASLEELSKRVPIFQVKPAELFFQPMEPGLRFGNQHGDQVCGHVVEFDFVIKNLHELKESVLDLEEEEMEIEFEREKILMEKVITNEGGGQLSRKRRAIKSKLLGKFARIIRKANIPLQKLYEIYHCCAIVGRGRRMCLLESWYNSLNKSCGVGALTDKPRKSYDGLFEKLYDIDGDVESCCGEADGEDRQTCFENVLRRNDSYSYSYSLYIGDEYSYSYSSWFEPTIRDETLEEEEDEFEGGVESNHEIEMHEGSRKKRGVWTAAKILDNNGNTFGSTLLQDDSSTEENSEEQYLRNLLLLGKTISGVCNRIVHDAGIASFGSFKTSKIVSNQGDEVNSHTTKRDSLTETLKFCCSIANDFVREMCFEDIRAENVDLECSLDEVSRTKHRRARKKLQRCCPLTRSERYECINDQDMSRGTRKKGSSSSWYTRAIIYKYLERLLPVPSAETEDRNTDRNDLRESRNKPLVERNQLVAKSKLRKGGSKQSKVSTRRINHQDNAHTNRPSRNSVDTGSPSRRRAADVINRCCRAGYDKSPAGLEKDERRQVCKRHLRVYTSNFDSAITSSCQKEFYRCCMAPSNTAERPTNTSRG